MNLEGRDIRKLRFEVDRGLLVSGMQATRGWQLLEEELRAMVEAYKAEAVSPKLVGEPYQHAAIVGGYNALQSLLDLLEITKERGKSSKEKLENAENERRDHDAEQRKLRRV